MPIIAPVKNENGKDFAPAPEGVHQAVCVDVVDLGWLEVTYAGQTSKKHKINIAWQIAEDREDGKPYLVFKRYTLSLHEKATLRKDIESWLGKRFGHSGGFDVETLIGKNCMLNVTHNPVGDKVYANVVSVMPLHKKLQPMEPRDYVRKIHRTSDQAPTPEYDEMNPPPITDDDIPF